MNIKIAQEVLRLARELMAIEFDSQDAMDAYLKEHPDADRSNHHVKKSDTPAPTQKPATPAPSAPVKPGTPVKPKSVAEKPREFRNFEVHKGYSDGKHEGNDIRGEAQQTSRKNFVNDNSFLNQKGKSTSTVEEARSHRIITQKEYDDFMDSPEAEPENNDEWGEKRKAIHGKIEKYLGDYWDHVNSPKFAPQPFHELERNLAHMHDYDIRSVAVGEPNKHRFIRENSGLNTENSVSASVRDAKALGIITQKEHDDFMNSPESEPYNDEKIGKKGKAIYDKIEKHLGDYWEHARATESHFSDL